MSLTFVFGFCKNINRCLIWCIKVNQSGKSVLFMCLVRCFYGIFNDGSPVILSAEILLLEQVVYNLLGVKTLPHSTEVSYSQIFGLICLQEDLLKMK